MRYSSIIFDLDGTLLDTVNDIGTAANTVLRDYFLGKLSKNDSVPKHLPKQSEKDRSGVTKNGPNGNNL